jgi:hypothetical protein
LPACAPTTTPPSASPPKATPEAFNKSRRVNPSDIVFLVVFFLVVFMIFSPVVVGFVVLLPFPLFP